MQLYIVYKYTDIIHVYTHTQLFNYFCVFLVTKLSKVPQLLWDATTTVSSCKHNYRGNDTIALI